MSDSPKSASSPKRGAKASMKRTGCAHDDLETQPLLREVSAPAPHVSITVADVAPIETRASTGSRSECGDARRCRICLEEEDCSPKAIKDDNNPFISPCLCAGSTKYVHRKCLEEWRNNGHRQDAFYRCEICKYEYRFQRVLWAKLLGSVWTVGIIFLFVMISSCFLLGYIPIFSLKQIEAQTHLNWWLLHMTNGALNMGVFGLVAAVVLGCLGLCNRLPGGNFIYFPSCPIICDCTAIDIAACGEAGVACVVVLMIIGFMVASYVVYMLLYTLIQFCLKNVEFMVENVSS